MKVLSLLLIAVVVPAQAMPQNATHRITPMEKRKPLVPGSAICLEDKREFFGTQPVLLNTGGYKYYFGDPANSLEHNGAGHPRLDDTQPAIVGGSAASPGQFPHQAAVIMDDAFLCGGSLISTYAVLTAGHCASGFSTWTVTLGVIRRSGNESSRVTITTRSATVHPGYNESTLINDIAVIFLGTNVKLNNFIRLVKLPSRSQAGNTFEGQTVTVSGFGRTADNGTSSDTLQFTTLTVISNSRCLEFYGSDIYPSTLCATGSNRQNTCFGDSGGPMVIVSKGLYTLIGVVSFVSTEGCSSGAPSGYARVTFFLDWIESTAGVTIWWG